MIIFQIDATHIEEIDATISIKMLCMYKEQHILLKKFTIFLKFKFLKKLRYSVIFFLSQPELAYTHWRLARVESRADDEKKKHDGWTLDVRRWRYLSMLLYANICICS